MGALAKFAEATVFLSGREPLRAKPDGHWSLGKLIADTLLDEDDIQHIAILIIGLPGSGKSTTAISIAMSAARHMAEATGKNPTEFFNLEECLWISDEGNTFVNTLGRSRQKIFVLDEGVLTDDSRDGMKKANKKRAAAAMTARDRRCCVIRTVQQKNAVDTRIRENSTHEIQIIESHHDKGYNVCKVKKLRLVELEKEAYREYLKVGKRDRIMRHIIYAPTKEDYEKYNHLRKGKVEAYLTAEEGSTGEISARMITQQKCETAWADYMNFEHEFIPLTKIATRHGIDTKTLRRWIGNVDKSFEFKKKYSPDGVISEDMRDEKTTRDIKS